MSRPMHFKCPSCNQYIVAPVKETRNEYDGVFRRRTCEKCGVILETLERITEYHEKQKRRVISYKSDNGYRGMLYGESSMVVYNPEGGQTLHTGSRNIHTFKELKSLVDTMPEFMACLKRIEERCEQNDDQRDG